MTNNNMIVTSSNSWLEISTGIFKNNLRFMSSILASKTKYMLMVKGNAYGHGLIEISRIAIDADVSYLGVASLQDAIILRTHNITIPILLLTEVESGLVPEIIKYNVTPTIYTLAYATRLARVAQKNNTVLPIHIKVDTGLNRFGFREQALQEVIKISHFKNIEIQGVFTHFADAIDELSTARKQLDLFNKICGAIKAQGIHPKLRHTSNSPALVWLKESHLDLVRFGLAAYGLQPSITKRYPLPIQPIMTWKTKILQIKSIKKGEYVGYGKSFMAQKDMTIAIIGVGYADGFRRSPLNYGNVLVSGEKVPIIGNVTMNFTIVDVTKLKSLKLYDEVVIIGRQKNSCITLEEIANNSGTINEEIAVAISSLIPRKYVK